MEKFTKSVEDEIDGEIEFRDCSTKLVLKIEIEKRYDLFDDLSLGNHSSLRESLMEGRRLLIPSTRLK